MARLPQPGGDDGTWGDLLNDFLAQEHNTDGTLKIKTDGTLAAKANDSAVVHLSGNETVNGIKTFSSSPIVPSPTTNTQVANKAYVDLAAGGGDPAMGGDLTGTASNAQLATGAIVDADVNNSAAIAQSKIANLTTDLAAKINSSEKGAANGVAQLDGSGKVNPGQLQTSNITKVLPYSYMGNVSTGPGNFRLYNDTGATWTITGVRASVGTAPTGAALIVDINKNGTTIFTTQANRPTIAAAANTSGNVTAIDITTVAAGEFLTVDIDQTGSTVTGADLTVQLEVY
jgi:hypothetical protein